MIMKKYSTNKRDLEEQSFSRIVQGLKEDVSWFIRQKSYLLTLLITAVCTYGFAITHFSIGVDDTMVEKYLNEGLEPVMGRWTIFLLNKFFYVGEFSPFMMELIGVMLLLLAVLLFCVLIKRILGGAVGLGGYILFSCAFVSHPFISEVYMYYYHDGVDVGFILLALSLLFFLQGMEEAGRRAVRCYLFSMLFLWAAVGCYESFLIMYVVGVLLILFFRGIAGRERPSFFLILKTMFLCLMLSIGCLLLRSLMQRFLSIVFSLQDVTGSAGLRNAWAHLHLLTGENNWSNLAMLIKRYWLVYCVNGVLYFPITVYVLSGLVFAACAVSSAIRHKSGGYLWLFLGLLFVPFLLTFAEGKVPLYRTCQYMPLFVASAVLLFYLICQRMSRFKMGGIFYLIGAILVWNQAFETNRNFYTDYKKYQYSKEVLFGIADEVEKRYGTEAVVLFTGDYTQPSELMEGYYAPFGSKEFQLIARLTGWLDPHLMEKYYLPYGYSYAGEAKYSVIKWGTYAFDHPGLELIHFLEMHGYSLQTVEDAELKRRAETFAEMLPHWPQEGAIAVMEGYVIIHL